MRILRFAVLGLFLALLFVGNVGVNVFIHHCDEDGDIVSFVFDESDEHCGSHVEVENTCCHKEEDSHHSSSDGINKDNTCCSDELAYYQLDENYSHAGKEESIQNASGTLLAISSVLDHTQLFDYYTSNYANPPPPDSKELLIKKQVWII